MSFTSSNFECQNETKTKRNETKSSQKAKPLPFFMVWGLLGYQQQKSPNKWGYASVTMAVHVALLQSV